MGRTTTRTRRLLGATVVAACVTATASWTPSASGASDALHRRVLGELKGFTDWLSKNHAGGFIGEVGWPNGYEFDPVTGASTNRPGESSKWNGLANDWYKAADRAKLWVTAFSAGEIISQDHPLRIYGSSKYTFERPQRIDTADASARIVEAHRTSNSYMRGVHDFGGSICVVEHFGDAIQTSNFSNHTPYVYDDSTTGLKFSAKYGENACYHYSTRASQTFLAHRGTKLVRLDFRWEHIQDKVGGSLRTSDVKHIIDYVKNAEAAGLTPIIDMHNYGHLYIWNGTIQRGVRTPIGSSDLPIAKFADVWKRLSSVFKKDPKVIYDLMNEPEELGSSDAAGARMWEKASQAALNAIRANGDKHLVMVEGYKFASVAEWRTIHPRAWIHDPAKNFRYEGHHYWNREASGAYSHTYLEEVADAQSRGY